MRRSETIIPQLLVSSETVLDSMLRLQGLDEEEYSKRALAEKDALGEEVNQSFPADYVWTLHVSVGESAEPQPRPERRTNPQDPVKKGD